MSTVAERAARPAHYELGRLRRLARSPMGRLLRKIPFWLLIAIIFVYALFPFYWAIRSAFTPDGEQFNTPIKYFPAHPTLTNFREVLSTPNFQHALANSTIVAASVTLLSLFVGSLAAFALGRFRFRGRSAVLYLMLSMTIFPQIAILGALYTLISNYHIYNSLKALILSYLIFTLPFTIWVLTSFMRALPGDLEEAAYVDGATPLQVFYKVLLPLIAPGLVTTGLLAFIASWNEYLLASELSSERTQPVTVAIANFTGSVPHEEPWTTVMAAGTIVTIPLIILVLILQRRIVAGLTAGGVKG